MGPCRNKAIYRYSRVDQACSSSRGCGRDKQRSKGHDGSKSRKVHRQGKISLRCSIRDSILALQTLKESWRFVGDTRRFLGVCYVQVLSLRPPHMTWRSGHSRFSAQLINFGRIVRFPAAALGGWRIYRPSGVCQKIMVEEYSDKLQGEWALLETFNAEGG